MTNLGSFGAAARELDPAAEKDTFNFFDKKFEVVGIIPPMLMVQLGAATTGKIDDQEGLGAMWEAMRCSLTRPEVETQPADDRPQTAATPADESQFVEFYKLAVAKVCDIDELMRLAMALFEGQAGRPTEEPAGSFAGPSTTLPSSNGSSSEPQAWPGMVPVAQVLGG
ncbi:hypothetical protein [Winogradskya humida]|uniref:Tail assembly chaperone n=1 Tax=Winogradskya humida TaxID=113566 RepID=A0ABQ4A767_9ACTN|nr:hypothetical protein [Actinoplanes humidus]GIE26695.1 hypothetical protein Ahu01nite_097970 [Actinoplanes humidus]